VAAYDEALELAPQDREARLGRAHALGWAGRLAEAAESFDAILAQAPADLEALVGRAQVAHWQGDLLGWNRLLRRARAIAPDDARLELEQEALDAVTAPRAGVKYTFSEDSGGFGRQVWEGFAEWSPFVATRLRLEPWWTGFEDGARRLERVTLGVVMSQHLPLRARMLLFYRAQLIEGAESAHDFSAEVGGPAHAPIAVRVGVRNRSLIDAPLGSYLDVAYFRGVGSEGMKLASIAAQFQVLEGFVGLNATPLPESYVYADAMVGRTDDDLRRTSVSAGAGLDLLQLFGGLSWLSLRAKYDYFYLVFDAESESYWTPIDALQVHVAGLEARFRPAGSSIIVAEAGMPTQPGQSPSYFAGGIVSVWYRDRLGLEGRLRFNEGEQSSSTAGTFALLARF
jgi:hypothetical protein